MHGAITDGGRTAAETVAGWHPAGLTALDALPGLDDYARLVVEGGANVQPGQEVAISADVATAGFVRALTRAAYAAGAARVDAHYGDAFVAHERIAHAHDDLLGFSPAWFVRLQEEIGERKMALISVFADPAPGLNDTLDPARVARSLPVEAMRVWDENCTNGAMAWTVCSCPTPGWAADVVGAEGVPGLWRLSSAAVGLDEADPLGAWRAHVARLERRAAALTERRFDAVRFHGGGTDLTVGLTRRSRWMGTTARTAWGQEHATNIPSEEVFTTPDRRRVHGVLRATRPVQLATAGIVVEGLTLRFERGRVTGLDAGRGADALGTLLSLDEGAAMLGEVALVDGASRVGRLGTTFRNTLFDENAACHVALGSAYRAPVEGADGMTEAELEALGVNSSAIHADVMLGGDEVAVDGLDAAGRATAVMRGGRWLL